MSDDITTANQKKLWKVLTTERAKDKIGVPDLELTFSSITFDELLEAGRLSLDNPTLARSAPIHNSEEILKERIQQMEEEEMWIEDETMRIMEENMQMMEENM